MYREASSAEAPLTPALTAIIAAPTVRDGGAVREASRPRVRLRSSCRRQLLFMRSFDFPPAVCSIRAQRRRRPSCCPHRCRRQTPASRPHAADDERICAHTRRGDNKQESNGRCSRAPERQRARTRRGRHAARPPDELLAVRIRPYCTAAVIRALR